MASSLSLMKVLLTDVDQSSIGEEDLQLVEYDEARVRDIAKDVIRAEVRKLEPQAKQRAARAMIARFENFEHLEEIDEDNE